MRMLVVLALMVVPITTAGNTMPELKGLIKKINPQMPQREIIQVIDQIHEMSTRCKLDPKFIAAVIAVESKFKRCAIGSKGEVGYMQLRPEYFGPNVKYAKYNISTGVFYLAAIKRKFEFKYNDSRWVEHYNRGPNTHPKRFPYTKKVLAYYREFGGTP